MTLQEKIQKKAEGFGKLAPVFLEGAEFALNNQWISIKKDMPYNHKELLSDDKPFCLEQVTKGVIIRDLIGTVKVTVMVKENNKWKWVGGWNVEYWMPIPKLPKE